MPELPEVETIGRGLARALEGRRIAAVTVRRADLRRPLPQGFAGRIKGRKVLSVRRRAKYLLIGLEGELTLLAHLGMSGRFRVLGPDEAAAPPERHDHVILATEDRTRVVFNDARRFGLMDLVKNGALESHPLLAELGPEPLGNEFSGPVLHERLKGRRTPVKVALLDQHVVAGVGNIYASEALFGAAIGPKRLARTIRAAEAERLAAAIAEVLRAAIASGGSTLRQYVQTTGEIGGFQHKFAVYDRAGEPCPRCAAPIRRLVQGGRSTYFCPRCQR